MRESAECREVLKDLDSRGLLGADDHADANVAEDEPNDEELLASLGVEASAENDVTQLVHVRSREEIKAAEEIAQRNPCKDFDEFKPIFEKVQRELETGERQTVKYKRQCGDQERRPLHPRRAEGHWLPIWASDSSATMAARTAGSESFTTTAPKAIFSLRSLQRALYKDKASRRITEPGFGPLFSDDEEEDDLATGYIYVLRSKSDHPFVVRTQVCHSQDRRDRRRREKPGRQREERPDLSSGRRGNRRDVSNWRMSTGKRSRHCCTSFSAVLDWIWN